MADIEGVIYGTTSNDDIEVGIKWSEVVNIAANSGAVTGELYFRTFTGYVTHSNDSDFSITINGNKVSYNNHYFEVGPGTGWTAVAFFNVTTVPHNADGTKSITVSATGSMYGTSMTSVSCSGTAVLYAIPRASAITSPVSTTNISVDGTNAVNVTLDRKVSTYTHTVRIFLGASYAAATYKTQITSVATSTTYAIPATWRKAMPSDTSMTANIEVDTFSGATQIGSTVPGTFIISVPDNIAPTVNATNAPVAPVQPTATAGFTSYVQGYSRAGVSFVAGSWDAYESPITGYYIQVGGTKTSAAPYQTAILNTAGTVPITVGVTDAREHTGTYTVNINVYAYSKPTLVVKSEDVYRSDDLGVSSETGAYIRILLSTLYSSVNGENSVAYLRGRYKARSSSTYGAWNNLNDGSATIIGGALLSTTSYDLEIQVQDELGNYTPYYFIIPTVLVPINFKVGNRGVAFGKYAETDDLLESTWPFKAPSGQFTGNLAVTSLTIATPLALSGGGLGSNTAAGGRATLKTYTQTFTSVTQLGFTAGVPTLNEVFAAMPADSLAQIQNGDLAAGESPALYGTIEIHRSYYPGWSYAVFYGRASSYGTFRKYLVSPYTAFEDTWVRNYDAAAISTIKTDLGISDPVTTTTPGATSILGGTISIFRLYKDGKVVTFNMQYSAITTVAGNNTEAAVIPAAYRPTDGYVALTTYCTNSSVLTQAYANSAGEIRIRVESPITNLLLSGSWITA